MAKTKSFFGRLIALIGGIFKHVLQGAEKTFKGLTPEQQASLKHASGVVALISQEAGKIPAEVRADIIKTFPDLDEAALEKGLFTIAHTFNLAPKENDLDDCIVILQTYLSTLHGTVWEAITQGFAGVLAVVFSPPETKYAAIGQLLEYVYETFFQKKNN